MHRPEGGVHPEGVCIRKDVVYTSEGCLATPLPTHTHIRMGYYGIYGQQAAARIIIGGDTKCILVYLSK